MGDGSIRTCHSLRLSGSCDLPSKCESHCSSDAEPVLRGERRECKFIEDDDNECMESGVYGAKIVGSILLWVSAPCTCCVLWCVALATCPIGDPDTVAESDDATAQSNDAVKKSP